MKEIRKISLPKEIEEMSSEEVRKFLRQVHNEVFKVWEKLPEGHKVIAEFSDLEDNQELTDKIEDLKQPVDDNFCNNIINYFFKNLERIVETVPNPSDINNLKQFLNPNCIKENVKYIRKIFLKLYEKA